MYIALHLFASGDRVLIYCQERRETIRVYEWLSKNEEVQEAITDVLLGEQLDANGVPVVWVCKQDRNDNASKAMLFHVA